MKKTHYILHKDGTKEKCQIVYFPVNEGFLDRHEKFLNRNKKQFDEICLRWKDGYSIPITSKKLNLICEKAIDEINAFFNPIHIKEKVAFVETSLGVYHYIKKKHLKKIGLLEKIIYMSNS